MPVLIGWTAVTDSLAWAPVVLFAVIFFWTPPHFWALAIRYRDDYSAASVPMLPSVADDDTVGTQIVALHARRLGPDPGLRPGRRTWAPLHRCAAVVLGAVFTYQSVRLKGDPTPERAMGLFHWSITYISLLFGVMAVDPLLT